MKQHIYKVFLKMSSVGTHERGAESHRQEAQQYCEVFGWLLDFFAGVNYTI